MRTPIDLPAWHSLQKHAASTRELGMRDLFAQDPRRAETFSLRWNEILVAMQMSRQPGKFQALGKSRHCWGLTGWIWQSCPSRKMQAPSG